LIDNSDTFSSAATVQPDLAKIDQGLTAAIVNKSDVGILVLDSQGRISCWNQWLVDSSQVSASAALGNTIQQVFPNLKAKRLLQGIKDCLNHGMSSQLSHKFNPHVLPLYRSQMERDKDLKMAQLVMIKPVCASERYALVQIFDVSSAVARDYMLRARALEHRNQELHTRAILTSITDAVITTDSQGKIDYMNPMAQQLTGWPQDQGLTVPLEVVFKLIDSEGVDQSPSLRQTVKIGKNSEQLSELLLCNRDNESMEIDWSLAPIVDENVNNSGVVVVFRDVSTARKLANQVSWQASHDSLTGLNNRYSFDLKLKELLKDAKEHARKHTLLYMDLDQFKVVNDTCGHVAGDELLRQVSQLLSSHLKEEETLARLGGDEFGVLITDSSAQDSLFVANKIRHAISNFRFGWGEKSFSIGVSIGLAQIQADSASVEQLLSAADSACYAAKDNGRNQVHVYQAGSSEASSRQNEMQWFTIIQSALEDDRFRLYAQAIEPVGYSAESVYYEVLIRMVDKQGELIAPGAFIPAAERYGLMSAIDCWVIGNVFELIMAHSCQFLSSNLRLAINLSGSSLCGKDVLEFITRAVKRYNIPAGMITFEITETAAISNLSAANHFIRELKAAGCLFSLDDFGSGLSSFAYLKNLPVDCLKIDGAFVKDMVKDPIDRAMVESINQIGHVMKLKTIAEFVENDEILHCVNHIGVDFAQGYGIAKPVPLIEVIDSLQVARKQLTRFATVEV